MPTAGWRLITSPASEVRQRGADVGGKLVVIGSKLDGKGHCCTVWLLSCKLWREKPIMANEIPVYLFVGFSKAASTKFIQETFEDPNFDSGDKTLLLVCEEGEEEYNEKELPSRRDPAKVLEDKAGAEP